MEALLLTTKGHPTNNFVVGTVPKPVPAANQLLVRIKCTALNPVDYKMAAYGIFIPSFPAVLGCDMSGVVEAVGSSVTQFKVGDAVAGYAGLGGAGRGTYATHCVIPEAMTWHKPDSVSFEQAATIAVSTFSAALGLYHIMKLARPTTPTTTPEWVLVWGGSGSVGSQAVQLAALSGYKVVAAASRKNEAWLKSLGATAVVDYHDSNAIDQIRKITGGELRYVYDAVGPNTAAIAVTAATPGASVVLVGLAGVPSSLPSNVRGEMVNLGSGFDVPAIRADLESYVKELGGLWLNGKIRTNEVMVQPGGFEGIVEGLKFVYAGKVGGKKVVVNLA